MTRVPVVVVKNIRNAVVNRPFILPLIQCGLSGLLLALSYPTFNLSFLAFFAFIPLLFLIECLDSPKKAFFYSYVSGLIFFAISIHWVRYVSFLGYVLLVLYLATYFGLFGLLARFTFSVSQKWLSAIISSLCWVFLEILRSIFKSGFGWALLGYSQSQNLPFIQSAEMIGVWGISFLVMLANFGIFFLLRRRIYLGLTIIFLLVCNYIYGIYKLRLPIEGTPLKVSVIQGNIPQDQKWNPQFKEFILRKYEGLTKQSLIEDDPDLIVWPETALPGIIPEDPGLLYRILDFVKRYKVPLLTGAVVGENRVVDKKMPLVKAVLLYNSAVYIDREGRIKNQYNKIHLVPFGEYLPMENRLYFIRNLIDKPIGSFTSGNEYTIFDEPMPFGVLICFEDTFPFIVQRYKVRGARFLINITNDAWFMNSSAPYQHMQASVFRAIENQLPVIRCANTGLTCFVDQRGRITKSLEVFTDGFLTGQILVSTVGR